MKETWVRNGIKYDRDKDNGYSDGYNAGRRYWSKRVKWWVSAVFAIGALTGAVLTGLAFVVGLLG